MKYKSPKSLLLILLVLATASCRTQKEAWTPQPVEGSTLIRLQTTLPQEDALLKVRERLTHMQLREDSTAKTPIQTVPVELSGYTYRLTIRCRNAVIDISCELRPANENPDPLNPQKPRWSAVMRSNLAGHSRGFEVMTVLADGLPYTSRSYYTPD